MQTRWVRKLTPGEGWREVEHLLTYFRWGVVGYVATLWWLGVFHTVSAVGSWLTLLLGVGYVATVQVLVWGWYRPQCSVLFAFLDACVISIPVFASGGAASPLVWLYFFVLIAAAVRFDLAYSALIAFVVVASFVASVATQPLYLPERDGALAWSWVLLLVLATAFAWLVANAVARQRQAVVVAQTELREARRRSDEWQAMFELGGRLATARSIPAALETAVAGALELTDREYAGALVRGGRREDALVVAICQRGARPQVGHRQPPTSGFEELIGKQRAFHTANSVGSFRHQLTSFFGFDVGGAAAIEIEGETMGLIVVSDGAPFDVGEREILQQVTHEVASTLERVRLLARERRRSTSLSALCEVSQAIGASLNVDEVLNCVVGSAVGLLAADAASFTLRDETGHPRVRAHRALGDGYLNRLEVSRDASLGATAFEQAQPVVIPDLLAVATPAAQVARGDGLRSYLAVPVRDEGIVIGLVEVFGRARLRRWTAEDLGLLSALADQAAVAIANARLFQAERDTVLKLRQLEAHRSDFVAMLSHELRTPVTSIKGYAQLLQRSTEAATKARKYADIIVERSNDLTGLISDVIKLSELENGLLALRKTPLSLAELLADAAERFSRTNRVTVAQRIPEELPIVRADPERVDQIVTNLLTSAQRGANDTATLEVGARADDEGVTVWIRETSQMAVPVVPDTLFEPLRPDEPADSGLPRDLGLYVSRRFVEAHGGKIWFADEESGGCGYYFKLYC